MSYNPDESRDTHGRWTSGGGSDLSVVGTPSERSFLTKIVSALQTVAHWLLDDMQPRIDAARIKQVLDIARIKQILGTQTINMGDAWLQHSAQLALKNPGANLDHAKWVAAQVTANAIKLGFDPARIVVTDHMGDFTKGSLTATAKGFFAPDNGRVYISAGIGNRTVQSYALTDRQTLRGGRTTAETRAAEKRAIQENEKIIAGLVAHETMHAKFHSFTEQQPKEYAQFLSNSKKMAAEDGVSKYSRAYWNAVTGKRPSRDYPMINKSTPGMSVQWAINETLAEMARIHLGGEHQTGDMPRGVPRSYSTTPSQPSKDWTALYNAVNLHWEGSHPRPRSERSS